MMFRRLRALPLPYWIGAALVFAVGMAAAGAVVLSRWLEPWLAALIAAASAAVLGLIATRYLFVPIGALFRALAGTVASYRDGDFAFGIAWDGDRNVAELVRAHNELGAVLREQRQNLVQRELLLDTMVQNTPVAMLLVDAGRYIVLGNLSARTMLGEGRALEGRHVDDLLASAPAPLREAVERDGDGMFTLGSDDGEDIYHLARKRFRLNGRNHELLLLRRMTVELRRAEVATWKKVIRVISHELNNSLAPIASLAHSGRELVKRGQHERLPLALSTIEERARHLEGFIRDYARFAKLPSPRTAAVPWPRFFETLRAQIGFGIEGDIPDAMGHFDTAQLEQALLNLLKNAHESGSAPEEVKLGLRRTVEGWRIDVLDRGCGMNDAVLGNALLPFYSTKRSGTGLGLALAREIAEAHGGHIALANREGGGLCVSLVLPE